MSTDAENNSPALHGRKTEDEPSSGSLGRGGHYEPGLLAEFAREEMWKEAVIRVREAGATRFEAFSPYPVEGMDELVLPRPSSMPAIMLAAGAIGATGGFFLQVWAARDYPLQVGSRPIFSWPAFVPVTFELGVLMAVLTGIVAFLWRARLPQYDHPAFASTRFARASTDRFFIWLPASPQGRELLASAQAESIEEVSE